MTNTYPTLLKQMPEDNKIRFALIDPWSLTRLSILHLLTAFSDDFVILPYPSIDEFIADYQKSPPRCESDHLKSWFNPCLRELYFQGNFTVEA